MIRIIHVLTITCFCLIHINVWSQIEIFSKHLILENQIYFDSDELNIVLSPDGNQLFFTRKNHSNNYGGITDKGDIWVCEKNKKGRWMSAYNIESINNKNNNRIIGFMDTMGRAMLIHTESGFGFLYNVDGKWLKPTTFEIPYFKSMSEELSSSISADGKYLLFGMESYGSYGVEDIYMSRLKADGSWTSTKNLGFVINSPNQEITPFLAADNKTLFFSSNGRGGEGSFDIFMSTRLDDTWQQWSEPVNLGNQVNTTGWERSFVFNPNSEFAYLVSTQNSKSLGDIKKVKIKSDITPLEVATKDTVTTVDIVAQKHSITIKGEVINSKTKLAITRSEVRIITEPTNITYTTLTDSTGSFKILIAESDNYLVKIRAQKYMPQEKIIRNIALLQQQNIIFNLEPIIEGNTVTLSHVLFEQGKSALILGLEKELDLVVEMMNLNPHIAIFLAGHTDNQGKGSLNIKLSEERVKTVTQYLISMGIDENRITGKGYGGLQPIASNASVASRKLNRRVVFTIHQIKK